MPEISYRAKLRTVLPENVENEPLARVPLTPPNHFPLRS